MTARRRSASGAAQAPAIAPEVFTPPTSPPRRGVPKWEAGHGNTPESSGAVLPFAGGRAEVARSNGTLWIAFSDPGHPEGSAAARPWVNRPCTPDTPSELRALADAVDRALSKA